MPYPDRFLYGSCITRYHDEVAMVVRYNGPMDSFRIYKCPECFLEVVLHACTSPARKQ